MSVIELLGVIVLATAISIAMAIIIIIITMDSFFRAYGTRTKTLRREDAVRQILRDRCITQIRKAEAEIEAVDRAMRQMRSSPRANHVPCGACSAAAAPRDQDNYVRVGENVVVDSREDGIHIRLGDDVRVVIREDDIERESVHGLEDYYDATLD